MKIALCDDEQLFLMQLRNNLEKISEQNDWMCEIDTYLVGEHFVQCLKDEVYDAVFLDIDMPGIDGFAVAEKIGEINRDTMIIFCTSHNELVYDSFSYQPFWFLCKNNYVNILHTVLDKMRKRAAEVHREIEFDTNKGIHRIEAQTIIYIDISKHRLCVHIYGGQDLNFRGRISDIEKKIDAFGFVKINSGTIVNMAWIKHIYATAIMLKNEITLPLSRGQRSIIQKRFIGYMRGAR